MTSLAAILDRIALEEAAITGVTKAFAHDAAPNSLTTAHLPCFVNMPGPATYQYTFGTTVVWQVRTIRLLFYYAPVERPSDVARHLDGIEPFYQRVIAKFKAEPPLNSLVESAFIAADDGANMLDYAGTPYSGVEFRMTVEQQL